MVIEYIIEEKRKVTFIITSGRGGKTPFNDALIALICL